MIPGLRWLDGGGARLGEERAFLPTGAGKRRVPRPLDPHAHQPDQDRPAPQASRDSSTPVRHVARPSERVFGDRFHIILRSIFREGHEITFGQSAGGERGTLRASTYGVARRCTNRSRSRHSSYRGRPGYPHPAGWTPPVPRAILGIGESKFLLWFYGNRCDDQRPISF